MPRKTKPLPSYIVSVEDEFDAAMRAQGDFERAHPIEAAVQSLEHAWKHNRFNSCSNYGDTLGFYMKQAEWATVKPLVEAKGLPVTQGAWDVVYANHNWKFRVQLVSERPKLAKTMTWFPQYEALKRVDHPVLKGEWKGDVI